MFRIDKIMRDKDITTQELGKMMHVSTQYISEVVNERKNITMTGLAKFAEALNVPVAALFDSYYDVQKGEEEFKCPYCGNVIKAQKAE